MDNPSILKRRGDPMASKGPISMQQFLEGRSEDGSNMVRSNSPKSPKSSPSCIAEDGSDAKSDHDLTCDVGRRRERRLPDGTERALGMELLFAISEGSVAKVKELLGAGVNPNFKDYEHRTPLHIAAGFGKLAIMRCLISHRADVNTTDMWGLAPLDQAISEGFQGAEELLRKHGAKLSRNSLRAKAKLGKWEIQPSEVVLGEEVSRTLKSVVYRATWNSVDVVAKFGLAEDGSDLIPQDVEEEMLHEIGLLASVRHPDLVMFLGCCLQEDAPIMFISPFMPGGDLENYYRSKRGEGKIWAADEKTVKRWCLSILRALQFLHNCSQTIIHRDLKPLNILLADGFEVKVADFGISKIMHTVQQDTTSRQPPSPKLPSPKLDYNQTLSLSSKVTPDSAMTGGVGSLRYMAPEVARHERYTEKVDIYSFALILYFISCGRQPFHEYRDASAVLAEYVAGNEPRPQLVDCPRQFHGVVQAAWDSSPAKRPSAAELGALMVDIDSRSPKCSGCVSM